MGDGVAGRVWLLLLRYVVPAVIVLILYRALANA